MGRRQQQQIPGVSAWILDSQSDLGVSKHPEGEPRTSREDLRVENPRWASAADRGCIAEFLRRLALRAQSGCSDRLPPLLRRSWYRVLSSEHRLQSSAVRGHCADADADPVKRSDLAPGRQADRTADCWRVARHLWLPGA